MQASGGRDRNCGWWGSRKLFDLDVGGGFSLSSHGIILGKDNSISAVIALLDLEGDGARADIATTAPPATSAAAASGAGRVGATILAVSNTQVGVLGLILDGFDGLDCVRNVGKVDESAVPTREN